MNTSWEEIDENKSKDVGSLKEDSIISLQSVSYKIDQLT